MIILPKRFIDVEHNLPKGRIQGIFTIRKIKRGAVIEERTFTNLITDYGLNKLGNTQVSQVYGAIQVGTGTATPAPSDTSLASFLAGQSIGTRTFAASGAPDYASSNIMVALFALGAVVGNVTEVAITQAATGSGTAFARALIVDGGGTPVAITVLADEQLEVTYELKHYPPLTDALATVSVGPNSHDTTTRALSANTSAWMFPNPSGVNQAYLNEGNTNNARWYDGGLSATTATVPLGSVVKTISGLGTAAYSNGSYARDLSASSNPANGAVSNAQTIVVRSNCSSFQVRYNPPLAKTADQTLVTWMRFSWARH